MSKWIAKIPDYTVKADSDVEAYEQAIKRVDNHKAGLIVQPFEPVVNAPLPPVVSGMKQIWGDDCSDPNPFAPGRWTRCTMERTDGQQASSNSMNVIVPWRFMQQPTAGLGGKPCYWFHCTETDKNVWVALPGGRSELNLLSPMFYEGQRRVTMLDIRLDPSFVVDLPTWRVIYQNKQDESRNWQAAPMLTMECRNGKFIWVNNWRDKWSCPAKAGVWTRWAFDVTYSSDPTRGKVRIYADLDGDNIYETDSGSMTMQTLLQQQSGSGSGIPSDIRTGIYEGSGGDSVQQGDFRIWAPV